MQAMGLPCIRCGWSRGSLEYIPLDAGNHIGWACIHPSDVRWRSAAEIRITLQDSCGVDWPIITGLTLRHTCQDLYEKLTEVAQSHQLLPARLTAEELRSYSKAHYWNGHVLICYPAYQLPPIASSLAKQCYFADPTEVDYDTEDGIGELILLRRPIKLKDPMLLHQLHEDRPCSAMKIHAIPKIPMCARCDGSRYIQQIYMFPRLTNWLQATVGWS